MNLNSCNVPNLVALMPSFASPSVKPEISALYVCLLEHSLNFSFMPELQAKLKFKQSAGHYFPY